MSALDWEDEAACQGLEHLFLPESKHRSSAAPAKAVCSGCPVRSTCLEHAMRSEGDLGPKFRFAVYGALTPSERYELHLQRQAVAA